MRILRIPGSRESRWLGFRTLAHFFLPFFFPSLRLVALIIPESANACSKLLKMETCYRYELPQMEIAVAVIVLLGQNALGAWK